MALVAGQSVFATGSASIESKNTADAWSALGLVAGTTTLPDMTGNAGKYLTTDGTTAAWTTLGGVAGPGSSTDNAIMRWDGTGGNSAQDSGVIVDDSDNMSGIASLTVNAGGALRTATSDTNTLLLQAYDVDGGSYTTFATLTAGDTPTFDLDDSVTKDGEYIYREKGTDVKVTDGGTGRSLITSHCLIVGAGTSTVTILAAATNGQVLIGSTGADPVFAEITAGEGIDTTLGAGSLTIACEDATTSNKGVVELANSAEAVAGVDDAKAITPSVLVSVMEAPSSDIGSDTPVEGYFTHFEVAGVPTDATYPSNASLAINPPSATADADLIWAGVNDVAVFHVNEDGDITTSGGIDAAGIVTCTFPPTGTTHTTSSLVVNPASATANADLLWLGVGDSAKFQVDENGNVSSVSSFSCGIAGGHGFKKSGHFNISNYGSRTMFENYDSDGWFFYAGSAAKCKLAMGPGWFSQLSLSANLDQYDCTIKRDVDGGSSYSETGALLLLDRDVTNVTSEDGKYLVCSSDGGTTKDFTIESNGALTIGNRTYASYAVGDYSLTVGHPADALGTDSVAFGYGAYAKTDYCIALGRSSSAKGYGAVALGYGAIANEYYSVGIGKDSFADLWTGISFATTRFSTNGDAQTTLIHLKASTTDATPTEAYLYSTHYFDIADEKAYACTITIIARQDTGANHAAYRRFLVIERTGGTTALVGSVQTLGTDIETDASWDVAFSADDTNDRLKVQVTGAAGQNIRWVIKIDAVEVGYSD